MHYVTSDIHGEFEKYLKLLEKINFKAEDRLYIIGDVVDRGPRVLDLVEDVLARPNVELLMGNHELMLVDALGPRGTTEDLAIWEYNGGRETLAELRTTYLEDETYPTRLRARLAGLPVETDIVVDGRKFHLVHAFPAENDREKLWHRPRFDENHDVSDALVVVGHTPTWTLAPQYEAVAMLTETGHATIYHAPHFIAIDCGCGHPDRMSRLACIRLEDMREFYV